MTDAPALFSLRKLGLSFRARPVLRGIDWDWLPGEHWALLGPNGAGKSALAGVLSGEHTRFSGEFERGEKLIRGGVAYVCFEHGRRLIDRDRRRHAMDFEGEASDGATRVRDIMPPADDGTFRGVIDLLGLAPALDRGPRFLSTGEMRKALLASALLSEPALLILDSPLDGLDRETQARFGAALDEIIAGSPAVLVLCRSRDEVPAACNRLLLLDRGRCLARGEAAPLLAAREARELLAPPPVELGEVEAPSPPERPPPDAGPTLELRDVSVSFGELCVFRHLDWRLAPDQHCLIAGPNGCGKSTLLDLLTGDNHKAYGQEVWLFGLRRGSGESVWDIKRRFGRVDARMQFAVPSGSRVEDVVLSGHFDSIGLHDRPSDRQRAAARRWLAALGLADRRTEEFQTLSFGLQRLVLLARAMVKAPQILLLDEATLSLDAGHRRLLLEAVDHVIAAGGCQLLFVSHTPGEVPRCINQLLRFEPDPRGSRVLVEDFLQAPA